MLFSEYKHEEREKEGEAICKKVRKITHVIMQRNTVGITSFSFYRLTRSRATQLLTLDTCCLKYNLLFTRFQEAIGVVADAWRSLSESERHYWTEQERNDKVRYVKEKEEHQGPWEQPKRRAKKHPLAPKRPMSAFLKYSKTRRKEVKQENPDMSNTDISRLLGEMWRNASPEERQPYREQEEKERAVYKAEIAKWRAEQARIEQERALSMPSTSSASSSAITESRPPDIGHYHRHQQSIEYDPKISQGSYGVNPLNHHDPNGSHFNEPSHYNDSARRGDGYDYSYHNTYHRPDYRQQYYHHDQYRHQARHGNSGSNEGGEGYSDFRYDNYYGASSSSHHSRPSQEGGNRQTYTYDSGTSGAFWSLKGLIMVIHELTMPQHMLLFIPSFLP